ncbi:MAG: M23 family metallopeptidase [Gordonia sp. (in: high G+C Gram-positive bacteria)]
MTARNDVTRDIPLPPRELRLGLQPADAPKPAAQSSFVKNQPAGKPATKHRAVPPNALKARVALVAVAAGATAMAIGGAAERPAESVLADQPARTDDPADTQVAKLANSATDLGSGVVAAGSTADMDSFSSQLKVGKSIAAAKEAQENAARQPLFVSPIQLGKYTLTSAYAPRWGTFHGGIDMAAPLGTPIHAATDGVVINAGPASGYGHWVQIRAADGTVTMYGHMAQSGVLVSKGQKVTAGDVIALVGNEGFSTGPHLHFEVWKNGKFKIDPAPWLASKGVRVSGLSG